MKRRCSALQLVEGLEAIHADFTILNSITAEPAVGAKREKREKNNLSPSHAGHWECCFPVAKHLLFNADFNKSPHFTRTVKSSRRGTRSVGQQSEVAHRRLVIPELLTLYRYIWRWGWGAGGAIHERKTGVTDPALCSTCVRNNSQSEGYHDVILLVHCLKSNGTVFSCLVSKRRDINHTSRLVPLKFQKKCYLPRATPLTTRLKGRGHWRNDNFEGTLWSRAQSVQYK